ncbi:hypothetical protein Sjap_000829 [Stephania japonica]|uniref:Uncharacterized protein n=1 Tax=Stephania japonica TaxID=461633 RepID=A0AAP0KKL9_9MAGN
MADKGSLDESKYSLPVPLIGLYVAGATLVCFLLILADITLGFRNKKPWLPCRWFALNSVTLTLLSIATKLPTDLTTPMPSAHDQLSKLSSNILLCICMGFLMPSLGTARHSECFTNMSAMTILVVTVFVNVCIQMRTGVIFSFKLEHIIVLSCMVIFLLLLWGCTFTIKTMKEISIDRNKSAFVETRVSLFQKLKIGYLYGYDSNPQFALCKHSYSLMIWALTITCLVVLVEATCRSVLSHKVESFKGVSDYKWSMWIVVVIQIITSLQASIGTTCRLIRVNILYENSVEILDDDDEVNKALGSNPLLKIDDVGYICLLMLRKIIFFPTILIMLILLIILFIPIYVYKSLLGFFSHEKDIKAMDDEFQDLIGKGESGLDEWSLRNGVDDMKRFIDKNKASVAYHLNYLSFEPQLSQESLVDQLKNQINRDRGYELTSLAIVLLVKVAMASMPSERSKLLTSSLNEIFDVIHFIDKKKNLTSFKNKKKCMVARAAWLGDAFHASLTKANIHEEILTIQFEPTLYQVREIIKDLRNELPSDFICEELCIITDFINLQVYRSKEDLYNFIERLFEDMLKAFLFQLPNLIFKDILESDLEDFEESVRNCLKLLFTVESLERCIQWSFPTSSNITCLSDKALIEGNRNVIELDNTLPSTTVRAAEESCQNVQVTSHYLQHEIIQVE